jgi:hypothetical protein
VLKSSLDDGWLAVELSAATHGLLATTLYSLDINYY